MTLGLWKSSNSSSVLSHLSCPHITCFNIWEQVLSTKLALQQNYMRKKKQKKPSRQSHSGMPVSTAAIAETSTVHANKLSNQREKLHCTGRVGGQSGKEALCLMRVWCVLHWSSWNSYRSMNDHREQPLQKVMLGHLIPEVGALWLQRYRKNKAHRHWHGHTTCIL